MTFDNFSWLEEIWSGYELRLISINEKSELPAEGEGVVIIATYNNDKTLHFRVFDAAKSRVVNESETNLQDQAGAITDLKEQLAKLSGQERITDTEKVEIIHAVASIAGVTQWATELHCRTRRLTQLYAAACISAWHMPHPWKFIHPRGLWGGRRLLVVGWLVRDVVVRHIQINLKHARYVNYLTEVVSRPTCEETRLGVKKTAPSETIQKAQEEQRKRQQVRQIVLSHMKNAAADLKSLEQEVGNYKSLSAQIINLIFGIVKHVSPLAFLTWVATQFAKVVNMPLWQGVLVCSLWIVIYNLLGLIAVPFHDAGYRKHLLFEGYIGTPDDKIKPLMPPVSRLEKEFYAHLGIVRPVVISWDDLLPPVHYIVTILMIVSSVVLLPLHKEVFAMGIVAGTALIVLNVNQLRWWRRLMRHRYDQSIPRLIISTFLLMMSNQSGRAGSNESEEGEQGK